MAIDGLGHRMQHYVRAQIKRRLQSRPQESVVNAHGNRVCLGSLGDAPNVRNIDCWVRRGLEVDEHSVVLYGAHHLRDLGRVDKRDLHAEAREVALEHRTRWAVNCLVTHHVLALTQQRKEDGVDRAHSARGADALGPVLKDSKRLFQFAHRWVVDACVDKVVNLARECSAAVFHILEAERRGLVDRHVNGAQPVMHLLRTMHCLGEDAPKMGWRRFLDATPLL